MSSSVLILVIKHSVMVEKSLLFFYQKLLLKVLMQLQQISIEQLIGR